MKPGEREFRAAVERARVMMGHGKGFYMMLWDAEEVLEALDEAREEIKSLRQLGVASSP